MTVFVIRCGEVALLGGLTNCQSFLMMEKLQLEWGSAEDHGHGESCFNDLKLRLDIVYAGMAELGPLIKVYMYTGLATATAMSANVFNLLPKRSVLNGQLRYTVALAEHLE